MATYPGAIVSLTNPTAADSMATVDHSSQHRLANDEVVAIETELGVSPKGSSASVAARLATLAPVASPTFTGVIAGTTQEFIDINRYGFLNQTETTIAFDGTSVFTLGSVGASWSYYRAGVKYTITGAKTIDLTTVDATLVDGSTYYIYIDGTAGTLVGSRTAWTLNDTKVLVATILWNNTLTPKYWLADERHTCLIDRRDHLYEHATNGARLSLRGALTGFTLNSDVNASKTFATALTNLFDEDILHAEGPVTQPNGATTSYVVFYRTAASEWSWKLSNMPFAYNIGNTNDWIQWDNAGTMTDATGGSGGSTRWVNSYLLVTCFEGTADFVIIPGQAIFTSLAAAQAESPATFTLTGFPVAEASFMYRLTWSTVTSTSQGKCRLAANPAVVNLSAVSSIGSGASLDHNSLAGLQGGTTAEYYHLTAAENTYKLSATIGTAKGDLITFSAASTTTTVAAGTAGQVLTMGTDQLPKWATATTIYPEASPATDAQATGVKITLTSGSTVAFGDVCYIASTGKATIADASVIATSSAVVMALGTIAADASGEFLLLGIARKDSWNWTVGGIVYLTITGTSANTLSQTAPTGADEVIQIIGIATHADRIYFNPSLSQVEHT